MPVTKRRNPFYILLVPAGAVFSVTAFAYAVMAFQTARSATVTTASAPHPLFAWLRAHGDAALLIELGVLAALTIAAIATDPWWDRPAAPKRAADVPSRNTLDA